MSTEYLHGFGQLTMDLRAQVEQKMRGLPELPTTVFFKKTVVENSWFSSQEKIERVVTYEMSYAKTVVLSVTNGILKVSHDVRAWVIETYGSDKDMALSSEPSAEEKAWKEKTMVGEWAVATLLPEAAFRFASVHVGDYEGSDVLVYGTPKEVEEFRARLKAIL